MINSDDEIELKENNKMDLLSLQQQQQPQQAQLCTSSAALANS